MKYLKLYENFDNRIDEMILYLKDILSDIEDEGFHVDLESHREKGIIHIYIYKPLKREKNFNMLSICSCSIFGIFTNIRKFI